MFIAVLMSCSTFDLMGQRWRIGHPRSIYLPIFFFHFVGPSGHAIRCRSPLCPFKGLRDARDKQQSSCQSRLTDETGAPPPKDIRQYLSYFSEIALKLLRHLLQFVLISCSCAVASSSKRGAAAHLHACITPHLHGECPTTSKPAQHYYALWNNGTTWLADSTGNRCQTLIYFVGRQVRADFLQCYWFIRGVGAVWIHSLK